MSQDLWYRRSGNCQSSCGNNCGCKSDSNSSSKIVAAVRRNNDLVLITSTGDEIVGVGVLSGTGGGGGGADTFLQNVTFNSATRALSFFLSNNPSSPLATVTIPEGSQTLQVNKVGENLTVTYDGVQIFNSAFPNNFITGASFSGTGTSRTLTIDRNGGLAPITTTLDLSGLGSGGGTTDTNDFVDSVAFTGTGTNRTLTVGRTGSLPDLTANIDLSDIGGGGAQPGHTVDTFNNVAGTVEFLRVAGTTDNPTISFATPGRVTLTTNTNMTSLKSFRLDLEGAVHRGSNSNYEIVIDSSSLGVPMHPRAYIESVSGNTYQVVKNLLAERVTVGNITTLTISDLLNDNFARRFINIGF